MKKKQMVKVFITLLCMSIIVLGISFRNSFKSQLYLHIDILSLRHKDKEFNVNLFQELNLKDDYNDHDLVQQKILSDEFKFPKTYNYPFIIKQIHSNDHRNTIIKDNFEDNYITFSTDDTHYSINQLSHEQKNNLINYVIKKQQDTSYSLPGKAEVEYEITDNEINYLKWDDQIYGKILNQSQEGNIWQFSILGKMNIQNRLTHEMFLTDYHELEKAVEDIDSYSGAVGAGTGLSYCKEYKDKYYFMYLTNLTGDNEPDSDLYAVNVAIEDADTIHKFIIKQTLKDNMYLYIGNVVLLIGASWFITNKLEDANK